MQGQRESLKAELLRLIAQFDAQEQAGPHPPALSGIIESLVKLSPQPAPLHHLESILGSWTSLYARYGSGTSKGKSERDLSDLSLQSFRVFPPVPIEVTATLQEIGEAPQVYNNIVVFRATSTGGEGMLVVHGTWLADDANAQRFRVVFLAAELRPLAGQTEAALRESVGLAPADPLLRAFKPAKLWSDVVYLDEDIRVNYGGMGGVYVLRKRAEPAVTL